MFSPGEPRTARKSVVDPNATPRTISYKYVGDVGEETKYRPSDYAAATRHTCVMTKVDGDRLGLSLRSQSGRRGHFVEAVEAGSLADRAGLRESDLVVEVDGRPVRDFEHEKVVQMLREVKGQVVLTVSTPESK